MALFSDVLLTVDFDLTLTAPDNTIPQRNLDAIRYFIANGGAFTVNTGRSLGMIRKYLDIIPVNAPLLLYNGSAAYDTQTQDFAFCHTIDLDMAQTLRECLADFPDMVVEIQGKDNHYIFREDPLWTAYANDCDCCGGVVRPEDDLGPFIKLTLYGQFHEPTVSHLFRATPEEMARCTEAEQALRRRYGEFVEVFRSGARIIDIHTKGVSKARSARQLQAQLGRKILVCVGDGENDVPMLQNADHAFCPAGSVICDRFPNVCHCADGAVADVICKKIPEILNVQP